MKKGLKIQIALGVLIAAFAPAIYYYFHDGKWDGIEFVKLCFLKLGDLALIGIFIRMLINTRLNSLKQIIATMCVIFVGGGWVLKVMARILEKILYSVFA